MRAEDPLTCPVMECRLLILSIDAKAKRCAPVVSGSSITQYFNVTAHGDDGVANSATGAVPRIRLPAAEITEAQWLLSAPT
jgi:hypothetical protein